MKNIFLIATVFLSSSALANEVNLEDIASDILATTAVSAVEANLESCTRREVKNGVEAVTYEKCYYDIVKDIRLTVAMCKSNEHDTDQACKTFSDAFANIYTGYSEPVKLTKGKDNGTCSYEGKSYPVGSKLFAEINLDGSKIALKHIYTSEDDIYGVALRCDREISTFTLPDGKKGLSSTGRYRWYALSGLTRYDDLIENEASASKFKPQPYQVVSWK